MADSKPWVADGSESDRYEDLFIGNRNGLKVFQETIQRALDSKDGQAELPGSDMMFVGIRVVDDNPFTQKPPRPTLVDVLMMGGCGLMVLFCLVVFGLGLAHLSDLFR